MDATDLDTFIDALIDDLTPVPARDEDRTLFHLLDCPRRIVDEQALLAVLAAAVVARNLVDHVIAQAVAAAERVGVPARKHLRTGADLLTSLGVAPGAAHRAARVGRAAHMLPALTRAQRLGGVGIEFADAVGKGVTHIHNRVSLSDEDRAAVVTTLMIQTTPSGVDTKAREIAIGKAQSQPPDDGVVPVAENSDLNEMTVVQTEDGRVSASLDLDILTGEELLAALDPLCRPVPLPDGSPDPRPTGRRRADAFGQLLRTHLSHSQRPMSGGVLPHVTLIRPTPVGVDCLGFTGPVSTRTAELITCDSTLTSVFVDGAGAPLDVGRAERLFTPLIRKGLAVRDGGCAHPGCGRPVSWCDAHHIQPWSNGGHTSSDNGVLLCRLHHSAIHHGGWQVYLGPDRHPWFIPPHDPAGPQPAHLRSHARRTMTDLPTAA
ncbi:hypothetical protein A7U43_05135 [Mycobacterium adipatum]|jgi:hypothetical protein|uniref:HNH nuclease domain-containing protein n=1 Tax=Mycobacterium adipatum TaxID=1682113 RepID=A0A172UI81_9MYCO|nr:HNH endonuclease signature motif containing protein [Mycobacterium adipatum]ANE78796.1 hypothetical protein A7U43_05135 [Mycobacterium adipatum]